MQPAMGEIARCVCNLENFESGRVEDRVEMRFLENRVRVYRDRVHLKYSKIRVNSSFPRFLSIIDYNSNIEAILMNRSRKISSSSRLKVLELDIFRDRGQRPRSNLPMAGGMAVTRHAN